MTFTNAAGQMNLLRDASDPAGSVADKLSYNRIHVDKATFKAGLSARAHRWFRLTPSFGPDLVREMLTRLECGNGDAVLDPFAGAGTTLIECQLNGINAYGFEINPFLHFVGSTSLNWTIDATAIKKISNQIYHNFAEQRSLVSLDNVGEYGLCIPNIHNPTRWWRPDVLADLILLKSTINSTSPTQPMRNFFYLALAGVLVPDLSNVTLGRLQLHFIDRTHDQIDVLTTFRTHCDQMIADLEALQDLGLNQTGRIILNDTTELDDVELERPIDCVITSPPYPNRYSYVWNTRPHLYFFDFLTTPKEAASLDKLTIGGTWGTATSDLQKSEVIAELPIVQEVVGELITSIRQEDNLMANYAMKYFNLIAKQIKAMDRLLSSDARVAYVIGCSRLKGIYVETDLLLAKLFEGLGLGYEVTSIERIRRRNSGKNLYESIVFAKKI